MAWQLVPCRWAGTECGKDQLWLLSKGLYFLLRYIMHWNNHLCLREWSICYIMISTWGPWSSLWALMIEVFCSSLQLTMNHSKEHRNTFPLTSKMTNTQMCGLFPSPLSSGFCVVVCLCYGCKQHSWQSEWASTEGPLAPRELILQILDNCVPCKGQYYIISEKLQFQEIFMHVILFYSWLIHTVSCLTSQLNVSGSYTGTMNAFYVGGLGCSESLTKVTAGPVKCCSWLYKLLWTAYPGLKWFA